jgi:hypothetical protein
MTQQNFNIYSGCSPIHTYRYFKFALVFDQRLHSRALWLVAIESLALLSSKLVSYVVSISSRVQYKILRIIFTTLVKLHLMHVICMLAKTPKSLICAHCNYIHFISHNSKWKFTFGAQIQSHLIRHIHVVTLV